ncbi:nuclear transport factor 2 family protein [Streptomyces sp. NPDC057302]|uniref:nuclear transport factor 2 family protein n=1 Tax=Streptomyces sp. NPDC057302 TaxID=3346094 RepID=UPI00362BC561
MTGTCETRRPLFQLLGELDTVDKFFEQVSDDVKWTMVGRHPLAGAYQNKRDFLDGTLEQIRARSGGLRFDLKQMYGTESEVVVVMEGIATATDGEPYDPFYVWLCRFEDDTIVEVQAYVDTRVVTGIIDRVPVAGEPHTSAAEQAEARATRVPGPLHRA